jgi:Domain of unknown function (DUF4347)/Domain of unknown function DUF11
MILKRTNQFRMPQFKQPQSRRFLASSGLTAAGLFALEPRQLFDGAIGATFEALQVELPAEHRSPNVLEHLSSDVVPMAVDHPNVELATRQLLVIDNRVEGWQALAESAGSDVDVLIIDAQSDGLVKIAERMVGDQQYSSLQIVSHGSSAQLTLGNRSLDAAGLAHYQAQLSSIGQSLTADGDILLYGCDIAAGNYGADFLSALARATQADVSASVDDTGSARLGGNWVLEASTGTIEAKSALSAQAQEKFNGLLVSASITVVQSSEPATAPDVLSTTNPITPEVLPVAVGEIVRLRAVVYISEDATPLTTQMRVALPDGVVFLNDGTATLALASDAGMLESDTLSNPSTTLSDGAIDASPSAFADVRTIRPDFSIPNAGATNAIANGTTNAAGPAGVVTASFASGDDIRFLLGDVRNLSSDADGEFVIIEFNVVVTNQLSNQDSVGGVATPTSLPVSFTLDRGGAQVSASDTDTLDVFEPLLSGVDKRVVSVVGNTVTFSASFTNAGNTDLHDVRIFDDFAGATNLSFAAAGSLPGGAVNSSTGSALDVSVPSVAAGATVTVTYTATVTDLSAAVPARDVLVTGTSLSVVGESLTIRGGEDGTGAPIAGLATSFTTGERSGADGPGAETTVLNNYAGASAAGLSTLSGRLWDDTLTPGGVLDAAEHRLGGVTVTLTGAGLDTVFGTADDLVRTTTTSSVAGSEGTYSFSALPADDYQITVPTNLTDAASGALRVSFDAGDPATTALNDGLITLSLPSGVAGVGGDFAYLKQNLAPTIAASSTLFVASNTESALSGDALISIADPDLLESFNPSPLPATFETVLAVGQGVLNLSAIPGVTMTGNGTGLVQLTGTVADINAALATLTYAPTENFAGTDSLTVTVNDRGNFGDFNGNGIPGESVADNRQAVQSIALTVEDLAFVNTPPLASSLDVVIDRAATFGTPASQIVGMPAPTDADLPPQALSIVVNTVPAATAGSFFLADGTPVQAGQAISIAQLQNLSFVPNTADSTPSGVDGLIPAGSLVYRVSDSLGASAQGAINVRVNPAPVTPLLPPRALPPIFTVVPPAETPPPTTISLLSVPLPVATPYSDLGNVNSEFDPYQPWAQNSVFAPPASNDSRGDIALNKVAPSTVKASNLVNDDCVDAPKVKPKIAKRTGASALLAEKIKPFSEQINANRKPFKRAITPNTNPATKC